MSQKHPANGRWRRSVISTSPPADFNTLSASFLISHLQATGELNRIPAHFRPERTSCGSRAEQSRMRLMPWDVSNYRRWSWLGASRKMSGSRNFRRWKSLSAIRAVVNLVWELAVRLVSALSTKKVSAKLVALLLGGLLWGNVILVFFFHISAQLEFLVADFLGRRPWVLLLMPLLLLLVQKMLGDGALWLNLLLEIVFEILQLLKARFQNLARRV